MTAKSPDNSEPDINELSFTELRDKLLALDPLNKEHVIKVNQAEAEFWRKSEGYRVGWADEILGFDCGGHQWVSETCFPAGTLAKPSMKDLEYIEELKQLIEKEDIPAPAPIEQRWTARSQSPMSPAYSSSEDDIFSWVISATCFIFWVSVLSSIFFLLGITYKARGLAFFLYCFFLLSTIFFLRFAIYGGFWEAEIGIKCCM